MFKFYIYLSYVLDKMGEFFQCLSQRLWTASVKMERKAMETDND